MNLHWLCFQTYHILPPVQQHMIVMQPCLQKCRYCPYFPVFLPIFRNGIGGLHLDVFLFLKKEEQRWSIVAYKRRIRNTLHSYCVQTMIVENAAPAALLLFFWRCYPIRNQSNHFSTYPDLANTCAGILFKSDIFGKYE